MQYITRITPTTNGARNPPKKTRPPTKNINQNNKNNNGKIPPYHHPTPQKTQTNKKQLHTENSKLKINSKCAKSRAFGTNLICANASYNVHADLSNGVERLLEKSVPAFIYINVLCMRVP